jgi:hypothetical protein
MSVLWTIIIGFVAGVIAKFLYPGDKYERPGGRVISSWPGRRFHWGNRWRDHNPGSVGVHRTPSWADIGKRSAREHLPHECARSGLARYDQSH